MGRRVEHLLGLPAYNPRLPRFSGALLTRAAAGANVFPDTVATAAPWDTVVSDTDGWFNLAAPTRLSNPFSTNVRVRLSAGVAIDANVTAVSGLFPRRNGANTFPVPICYMPIGGNIAAFATPAFVIAPGDYLEIFLTQTSGAARAYNAALFAFCFAGIEVVPG